MEHISNDWSTMVLTVDPGDVNALKDVHYRYAGLLEVGNYVDALAAEQRIREEEEKNG